MTNILEENENLDAAKSESPRLPNGYKLIDYEIVQFIAQGAFGAVYEVKHINSLHFALKIESRKSDVQNLKMEVLVLKELEKLKSPFFCRLYFCAKSDKFNIIIMSLTGKHLNEIRANCKDMKFSKHCGVRIAIDCLSAIQLLHGVGYIHRDIKPANFCISLTNPTQIILLDFGFCRKYLDSNGQLRHPRWYTMFKGTVRYGSIGAHHGHECSRKDDLESWLYVVVEFIVGTLPWYTMTNPINVAFSKHGARTKGMREFLSGCPKELLHIMMYIDSLKYYDAPDYALIRGLLTSALAKCEKVGNLEYDWEAEPRPKIEEDTSEEDG